MSQEDRKVNANVTGIEFEDENGNTVVLGEKPEGPIHAHKAIPVDEDGNPLMLESKPATEESGNASTVDKGGNIVKDPEEELTPEQKAERAKLMRFRMEQQRRQHELLQRRAIKRVRNNISWYQQLLPNMPIISIKKLQSFLTQVSREFTPKVHQQEDIESISTELHGDDELVVKETPKKKMAPKFITAFAAIDPVNEETKKTKEGVFHRFTIHKTIPRLDPKTNQYTSKDMVEMDAPVEVEGATEDFPGAVGRRDGFMMVGNPTQCISKAMGLEIIKSKRKFKAKVTKIKNKRVTAKGRRK